MNKESFATLPTCRRATIQIVGKLQHSVIITNSIRSYCGLPTSGHNKRSIIVSISCEKMNLFVHRFAKFLNVNVAISTIKEIWCHLLCNWHYILANLKRIHFNKIKCLFHYFSCKQVS